VPPVRRRQTEGINKAASRIRLTNNMRVFISGVGITVIGVTFSRKTFVFHKQSDFKLDDYLRLPCRLPITAPWPVLISCPAEGRRLSWPEWLVACPRTVVCLITNLV